ncbi:signal recognition particle-docking protein FtsY [Legionella qingyii]|uniref:Signal recognition particle receptor FtsY n=1 Tax=Legionella qingyii TaxID=2184757 RepID=A0A317U007_9GAMM|nr:signal recognition particle-docking protein FtsY [Legionella qingyii]PWY54679.1 signal recognition particle-docking protein FtsY [Legionella qingyii]RUR20417.1 signal recognition particle-docking protein FtsY [Legionella qingyii]RUR29404.1 signal recognition particle-docking protein FtsY [Legionella qingyii]
MIKWFKKSHNSTPAEPDRSQGETDSLRQTPIEVTEQEQEPIKEGIFARFRKGLSKTRHQLGDGLGRLLLGKKEISQDLLDELETLLVSADLGVETTQAVLNQLTDSLARKQLSDGNAVYDALKSHLQSILSQNNQPLTIETADHSPFVILMVGVNGAGKTTTIGKLAKQFQQQGKKVMLAAGDTFRAAAVEQLHVWGERNDIPVIAQHTGADSASVIFDALQAAKARKIDVLIADTAGRLHTQGNLMDELKKVKRVLQKLCPEAPHETMLILDASIGQNALVQARQFNEAIGLTGITMTKLDGTAKGGILFAIANELGIPFRYIGIGEGIEDLRPFDAAQFVGALFNDHI